MLPFNYSMSSWHACSHVAAGGDSYYVNALHKQWRKNTRWSVSLTGEGTNNTPPPPPQRRLMRRNAAQSFRRVCYDLHKGKRRPGS
jgi:hypothetical protein